MHSARITTFLLIAGLGLSPVLAAPRHDHDLVIRHAIVYDGSGGPPIAGEIAIDGDRIVAIGPRIRGRGKTEIDAGGRAAAPGFINMLAHPEESLIVDGRGLSDLKQGVTLEVLGEDTMGPLSPTMQTLMIERQAYGSRGDDDLVAPGTNPLIVVVSANDHLLRDAGKHGGDFLFRRMGNDGVVVVTGGGVSEENAGDFR